MPRAPVSMQRIAEEAGVSKFAVSRALAGKGGVSEPTRLRVQQIAARLGYRAEAPAGQRVLFIIQEQDPISSELRVNMLHGAERAGHGHGLRVTTRQARQFLEGPIEADVAGIILSVLRPAQFVARALRTGLPLVCGGYVEPLSRIDHVILNDWEGGAAVAQHLAALGHRRVGFVRGQAGLAGRAERLRGLRDAMADVEGSDVREIGFEEPGGFRDALLAQVAVGFVPTALFCAHDGVALTVISELLRLGVRVPGDVSVVGFNDFVCATQIVPQLTTIRVPQEAWGEMVARCLAMRIGTRDTTLLPPMRITLSPELVVRESTAAAVAPAWAGRVLAEVG